MIKEANASKKNGYKWNSTAYEFVNNWQKVYNKSVNPEIKRKAKNDWKKRVDYFFDNIREPFHLFTDAFQNVHDEDQILQRI